MIGPLVLVVLCAGLLIGFVKLLCMAAFAVLDGE